MKIFTHKSVDGDAAVSSLMLHFVLGYEVGFITQAEVPDAVASGHILTDIGLGEFDHHQFGVDEQTSAAMLVYERYYADMPETHVGQKAVLREFVELVHDADMGKRTPQVEHSRKHGFHAVISGMKIAGLSDAEIIAALKPHVLDIVQGVRVDWMAYFAEYAKQAYNEADVVGRFREGIFTSDGKTAWFPRGGTEVTQFAYAQGVCNIIAYAEDSDKETLYFVIMRGGYSAAIGVVIGKLVDMCDNSGVIERITADMQSAFVHNAGFTVVISSPQKNMYGRVNTSPQDWLYLFEKFGELCELDNLGFNQ